MKKIIIALTLIAGIVALLAVGKKMNTEKQALYNQEPVAQNQETVQTAKIINQSETLSMSTTKNITLVTNEGNIEIELFADVTPNTVENFVTLAGKDFYDNTKFHRVIDGFMIQGGDPLSKDDAMMARWGTGGPGYQFADEITSANKNDRGTISMANAGPNTNGSQFFINVADNNFLDTKHTVFGKVVKGMDVVDAISKTPTGQADRPIDPIVITDVVIK